MDSPSKAVRRFGRRKLSNISRQFHQSQFTQDHNLKSKYRLGVHSQIGLPVRQRVSWVEPGVTEVTVGDHCKNFATLIDDDSFSFVFELFSRIFPLRCILRLHFRRPNRTEDRDRRQIRNNTSTLAVSMTYLKLRIQIIITNNDRWLPSEQRCPSNEDCFGIYCFVFSSLKQLSVLLRHFGFLLSVDSFSNWSWTSSSIRVIEFICSDPRDTFTVILVVIVCSSPVFLICHFQYFRYQNCRLFLWFDSLPRVEGRIRPIRHN